MLRYLIGGTPYDISVGYRLARRTSASKANGARKGLRFKGITPNTAYIYVSTSKLPIYRLPNFNAGLFFVISLSRRYPTIPFILVNNYWRVKVGKGNILSFTLLHSTIDQDGNMHDESLYPDSTAGEETISDQDSGNSLDYAADSDGQDYYVGYNQHRPWVGTMDWDSSGDGVSSTHPRDPLPPEIEPGDTADDSGGDSGISNDPDLPQLTGGSSSGEWVDQDMPKYDPGIGGHSEPPVGIPGYGDYNNEVEEGTVLQPSNPQNPYDSEVWYDNDGEPYFYDQKSGTFSDLNGVSYTPTVTDGVTRIEVVESDSGGDPADILEPDWNDPGDDDSWVDNYDDLPR